MGLLRPLSQIPGSDELAGNKDHCLSVDRLSSERATSA